MRLGERTVWMDLDYREWHLGPMHVRIGSQEAPAPDWGRYRWINLLVSIRNDRLARVGIGVQKVRNEVRIKCQREMVR